MIDKNTVHEFETSAVVIQLTEYPFYSGEETHLKIEPTGKPDYVSLHGNPKEKQTLTITHDDFYMWVESEKLFELLVNSIEDYRRMWNLNPENAAKVEANKDNLIKVSCPACGGDGFLVDEDFESKKEIKTLCLSCRGSGFTFSEPFVEVKTNED